MAPAPVTFTATVSASSLEEATAKVAARLPAGWTAGAASVRSARHLLHDVEVAGSGDRDAAWVALTSYGISPSATLGSTWGRVLA